jgi:hypothetical protein
MSSSGRARFALRQRRCRSSHRRTPYSYSTINGGSKGILVITGNHLNICKKPQISSAKLFGQNGKSESVNLTMSTPCAGG